MKELLICGIDEVGRGCLAGPIVAACALFRFNQEVTMSRSPIRGLADSKTFSTVARREKVWEELVYSPYLLDMGVGECSVEEINERGIDWCNNTVFQRAIMCLKSVPDVIYVDGVNPIIGWPRERQQVEAKSDLKYWPVSAASIIAKVVRDRLMDELDRLHPGYAWASNKGYGSEEHQNGIRRLGPTPHHRKLFIRKIVGG
jgi:ribonuclease HII